MVVSCMSNLIEDAARTDLCHLGAGLGPLPRPGSTYHASTICSSSCFWAGLPQRAHSSASAAAASFLATPSGATLANRSDARMDAYHIVAKQAAGGGNRSSLAGSSQPSRAFTAGGRRAAALDSSSLPSPAPTSFKANPPQGGKEAESRKPPDENEVAQRNISEENVKAAQAYARILKHQASIPQARAELDKAMSVDMSKVHDLCQKYMLERANLTGIAGVHCKAAQGRLNQSELTKGASNPTGCVNDDVDDAPEAPEKLPDTRCSNGNRELLCSARLKELAEHEPAPGEPIGGPSMDERVREWCHPLFSLPSKYVSDELGSGLPDPKGMQEEEMQAEPAQA